jgi:hypothetical protein
MPDVHELPISFPNDRACLRLTIVEVEAALKVRAEIFDGLPNSLKTPETVEWFATPSMAVAWGDSYAEEFLPTWALSDDTD